MGDRAFEKGRLFAQQGGVKMRRVQHAIAGNRLVHHALVIGFLGDIGDAAEGLAALGTNGRCRPFDALLENIDDAHLSAFGGEPPCRGTSYPQRRACHQRDLALETPNLHDFPLPCSVSSPSQVPIRPASGRQGQGYWP